MSKSNGPSDEAHEAALSLIWQSLCHSNVTRQPQFVVASIPDEYWPDANTKHAAKAIKELYGEGIENLDYGSLHDRMQKAGSKLSVIQVYELFGCHPIKYPSLTDLPVRIMYKDFEKRDKITKLQLGMDLLLNPSTEPGEFERFITESDLAGSTISKQEQSTVADTFADWEILAEQPIPWLFNSAIEYRTVSILSSPGGIGKSMISIALAMSVALGRTLLPSFVPTGKHPACVLSGEDDKSCVGSRLKAIKQLYDLPQEEVHDAISNRFRIRGCSPKPFLKYTKEGGVSFTAFHAETISYCKEHGIRFLVVDHARKFSGLKDENSNTDAGAFISACQQIAEECDLSVLVLAHANKQAATDTESRQGHVRGASAFGDESRAMFNVTRNQDESLTMYHTKGNHGKLLRPVTLTIESVGSGRAAIKEVTDGTRDPLQVADTLRGWIESNGGSITENGARRRNTDDGKKAYGAVTSKHRWCDLKKLNDAIDGGIKAGILVTVSDQDAKGRERSLLRAGRKEEEFDCDEEDGAF